jgi:PKD repeat protein
MSISRPAIVLLLVVSTVGSPVVATAAGVHGQLGDAGPSATGQTETAGVDVASRPAVGVYPNDSLSLVPGETYTLSVMVERGVSSPTLSVYARGNDDVTVVDAASRALTVDGVDDGNRALVATTDERLYAAEPLLVRVRVPSDAATDRTFDLVVNLAADGDVVTTHRESYRVAASRAPAPTAADMASQARARARIAESKARILDRLNRSGEYRRTLLVGTVDGLVTVANSYVEGYLAGVIPGLGTASTLYDIADEGLGGATLAEPVAEIIDSLIPPGGYGAGFQRNLVLDDGRTQPLLEEIAALYRAEARAWEARDRAAARAAIDDQRELLVDDDGTANDDTQLHLAKVAGEQEYASRQITDDASRELLTSYFGSVETFATDDEAYIDGTLAPIASPVDPAVATVASHGEVADRIERLAVDERATVSVNVTVDGGVTDDLFLSVSHSDSLAIRDVTRARTPAGNGSSPTITRYETGDEITTSDGGTTTAEHPLVDVHDTGVTGTGAVNTYELTVERVGTGPATIWYRTAAAHALGDGDYRRGPTDAGTTDQQGFPAHVIRANGTDGGEGGDGNYPPTVDTGPDRTVSGGGSITLEATGSDPDGDRLAYAWRFLSSPSDVASNDSTLQFDVPATDRIVTGGAEVTVTDSDGATATDVVYVTVVPDDADGNGSTWTGTVDDFEDGDIAEYRREAGNPDVASSDRFDAYRGDRSLYVQQTDAGPNSVTRSFGPISPDTLRAAVSVNSGSDNGIRVVWETVGLDPVAGLTIENDNDTLLYEGRRERPIATVGSNEWVDVRLDEIDWAEDRVGRVVVDGETVARNLSFAISTDAVTSVSVHAWGGPADQHSGNVDDLTVGTRTAAPNRDPTAALDVTPASPSVDDRVSFDASGSADPDGEVVSYEWRVEGPGPVETVTSDDPARAVRRFSEPGRYEIRLSVTDDDGATTSLTEPVAVAAPSAPEAPATVGTSTGDPHLTTFDGLAYDFQAAGEFVLADDPDGRFVVQVRQVPVDGRADVTVNTAVATRVDNRSVTVDARDATPLSVDGEPVNVTGTTPAKVGAGRVFYDPATRTYRVVYPGPDGVVDDGDAQLVAEVVDDRLDLAVHVDRSDRDRLAGLLGDADGDPADDIAYANETPLARPPTFEHLYGPFRADWRVNASTSLFAYDETAGPETYYRPSVPAEGASVDDFPAAAVADARHRAVAAGLVNGTVNFRNAVLDYLLTGDSSYFGSARTAPPTPEANLTTPTDGSSSTPAPSGPAVDGFEDGDLAEWSGATSATVSATDPWAGDHALRLVDGNDEMNADTGSRLGRTVPRSTPSRVAAAVRIDDQHYNDVRVTWRNDTGAVALRIHLDNYRSTLFYGPDGGVDLASDTWYRVAFAGVDWADGVVSRVLIDGETVANDVPFVSPVRAFSRVTASVNSGGTGATGGVDELTVGDTGSANEPPTAAFSVEPTTPTVNESITLTARNATDPDGRIVDYDWSIEGPTARTLAPTVEGTTTTRYTRPGTYDVTLTVTDDDGATASSTESVTVAAPSAPRPAARTGVSTGDPHLITIDGLAYDFQAAGEFRLLASPNGSFAVQARQEPVPGRNATVNTATATRVDGHRVVIDARDATPLSVDGEPVNVTGTTPAKIGAGRVFYDPATRTYRVVYPGPDGVVDDGDAQLVAELVDDRLDLAVHVDPSARGPLSGLLGDADGDPADDLAYANGTPLARPPAFEHLYGPFRADWRVNASTSLFAYDDGGSAGDYFRPDVPAEPVTTEPFPAGRVADAEAAAREAGLDPGTVHFRNAVLDYLLTGDPSYFGSARNASTTPEANVSVPEPSPDGRATEVEYRTTFETGLAGWTAGYAADATRGTLAWSDAHDGSARLRVDGAPGEVRMSRAIPALSEGDRIEVAYAPERFGYAESGLSLRLVTPDGETIGLDAENDHSGLREQNGTMIGTVPRPVPNGTRIQLRLRIWPGATTVYVTNVTVLDPRAGPEAPRRGSDTDETVIVGYEAATDGLDTYEVAVTTRSTTDATVIDHDPLIDADVRVTDGGEGARSLRVRGDVRTRPAGYVALHAVTFDRPVSRGDVRLSVHTLSGERSLPADRVRLSVTPPFDGSIPGTTTDRAPTDPDGDGKVEDLTGDGRFDFSDVIEFVFALDRLSDATLTDRQRAALDHSGDGTVRFTDVIDLVFSL